MKSPLLATLGILGLIIVSGCAAPSSFDGYVHAECTSTDVNHVTTCSSTQMPIPTVTQTVTATAAPAPTPTPTPTPTQTATVTKVNDTSFTYAGTWNTDTPATAYLANNHWILGTTATSWTYAFTGTKAQWYGEKSPGLGIVCVSIDGGACVNVDPYASSRTEQNLLFTSADLVQGAHTIKVTPTGTKNAASTGTYASADRLDVTSFSDAGTATPTPTATPTATTPAASAVPAFDHIVYAVFENTAQGSILGNSAAPYFNGLAASGANLTGMHAETHPSEPNYLAMYAGSTFGIADDNCRTTLSGPSLGTQLITAGKAFIGYGENLDADGSTTCVTTDSLYKSKHNPWAEMSGNAQFGHKFSEFPTDFTTLPAVSFVIPNMCNDIHDCSIATGDAWLSSHLDAYKVWAAAHNSLLVVTFDEDDTSHGNAIYTTVNGARVIPGAYSAAVNHYDLLGMMEDANGLARIAGAVGKPALAVFQ